MAREIPVSQHLVPSLLLGVGVGGSAIGAAAAVWRRHRRAPRVSLAASAVLGGWIAGQLSIIGYRSPLQPAMLALAAAEAAIARRPGVTRPKRAAASRTRGVQALIATSA